MVSVVWYNYLSHLAHHPSAPAVSRCGNLRPCSRWLSWVRPIVQAGISTPPLLHRLRHAVRSLARAPNLVVAQTPVLIATRSQLKITHSAWARNPTASTPTTGYALAGSTAPQHLATVAPRCAVSSLTSSVYAGPTCIMHSAGRRQQVLLMEGNAPILTTGCAPVGKYAPLHMASARKAAAAQTAASAAT